MFVQIFSVCNQRDKNTLWIHVKMMSAINYFSVSYGVGVSDAILKLMWAITTFHMKNPAINS